MQGQKEEQQDQAETSEQPERKPVIIDVEQINAAFQMREQRFTAEFHRCNPAQQTATYATVLRQLSETDDVDGEDDDASDDTGEALDTTPEQRQEEMLRKYGAAMKATIAAEAARVAALSAADRQATSLLPTPPAVILISLIGDPTTAHRVWDELTYTEASGHMENTDIKLGNRIIRLQDSARAGLSGIPNQSKYVFICLAALPEENTAAFNALKTQIKQLEKAKKQVALLSFAYPTEKYSITMPDHSALGVKHIQLSIPYNLTSADKQHFFSAVFQSLPQQTRRRSSIGDSLVAALRVRRKSAPGHHTRGRQVSAAPEPEERRDSGAVRRSDVEHVITHISIVGGTNSQRESFITNFFGHAPTNGTAEVIHIHEEAGYELHVHNQLPTHLNQPALILVLDQDLTFLETHHADLLASETCQIAFATPGDTGAKAGNGEPRFPEVTFTDQTSLLNALFMQFPAVFGGQEHRANVFAL